MLRIRKAIVLEARRVCLFLDDGKEREVDLAPYLHGPMFESIAENDREFGKLQVDPELGTIVWPNGADLCPDVLIHGRTPAAQEVDASK